MKHLFLVSIFLMTAVLMSACEQNSLTAPNTNASVEAGENIAGSLDTSLDFELVEPRSLKDFVQAQGSFEVSLNEDFDHIMVSQPTPQYIGWLDAKQNRAAVVDYAAIAESWLIRNGESGFNTIITGSVNEQKLDDGRALVKVVLLTKNALVWVTNSVKDYSGNVLLGQRPKDLLDSKNTKPLLGESRLELVFINNAPGAPFPDLVELFARNSGLLPEDNRQIVKISFSAKASGPLAGQSDVGIARPVTVNIIQEGQADPHFQFDRELIQFQEAH